MWIGAQQDSPTYGNLFKPHPSTGDAGCKSGETFFKVMTRDGVDLGYCVDNAENAAGAQRWSDARNTCIGVSKRLPEPAELQYACRNSSTIASSMTGVEWASNVSIPQRTPYSPWYQGPAVPVMGNGSGCDYGAYSWVAISTATASTQYFRCVH
jgi:formylglycine-generating enzyme required for sulfatase activity